MLLTPLQREVIRGQFKISYKAIDMLQHVHTLDQYYRSDNGLAKGYKKAAGQTCLGGSLSAAKELVIKKLVYKRLVGNKGRKHWYLLLTPMGKAVFEVMEHCNKTVDALTEARQSTTAEQEPVLPAGQKLPPTRVSWGRQGELKIGTVLAYVPAINVAEMLHGVSTLYKYVTEILEIDIKKYDLGSIKPLTSDTFILLRKNPSALVVVDRGATRKPALYWPTKYTELVEAK